ncbi:MAG: polysaccharide pyruvyl transferase family protein [Flavobacteriaceae bacterium]|nr:polysaccharide pyruvyl transferase family protein [Flavobacteriaceae bacterium]
MKILMFFHGGSKNRGCEAIVRSSVALIKKQDPSVTVDLISLDAESDKIIPLIDTLYSEKRRTIRKFTFNWFLSFIYLRVFKDENFAYRIIHKDIIDKIPNYDLFLSIGGDNYCYGEQPGFYEINRCIKKAGKKLVLWGASIGTEDLSIPKIKDLKNFDLVLVRESVTESILKNSGIQNVKLCADGAFTMNKEELPLPEGWQEGNTIGFNYSPLVWKKNEASHEAALDLVQHILNTTSMTIAFTPHVIDEGNDDYACLLEFYNKFKDTGRVLILPNTCNAIQYKGYIARMRYFIGARTHATIAAYSSCVPTMVLGYSVKSKGIATDIFGTEKLVLSLEEIASTEKLIAKFDEMVAEETQLKTLLQKRIPAIQEMSFLSAKYLFEVN